MSKFAKTPEEYIRRLGELSKSEIRTLLGLLLSKNQATGRCDPKQVTIAALIGMNKSHVSEALAGLEAKGWAVPNEHGNYVFPDEPPKVPSLGTFRKTEQKVPDFGKKVPESGTSYIEEQNQQKEEQKRGTRIPDPFLLTAEMRAYAAERRPDIDVGIETEKFCNYWRAKAGQGARKLDWTATWRNWILNAKGGRNGKNQFSASERNMERLDGTIKLGEQLVANEDAVAGLYAGLSLARPENPAARQLAAGDGTGGLTAGRDVGGDPLRDHST
ncbi:MAG: helix-turn-helix domain-containing protein [Acidobacteria bacterium]|nr:helix-turn-helix domain-containing protein [Acidobacteriota bacterium]